MNNLADEVLDTIEDLLIGAGNRMLESFNIKEKITKEDLEKEKKICKK